MPTRKVLSKTGFGSIRGEGRLGSCAAIGASGRVVLAAAVRLDADGPTNGAPYLP